MQRGSGTITVQFFDVDPYVSRDSSGRAVSIEFDLMQAFVRYVQRQYGVHLTIAYDSTRDFNVFYKRMLAAQSGYFSVGPLSITEERQKLIAFSPPYMPDIQVIVSNPNVPLTNTPAELVRNFSGLRALAMPNSTFETQLQDIRAQYLPNLVIERVSSGQEEIRRASADNNVFCYLELPAYLAALKSGTRLRRHNVLQVRRAGYAIGFAKNSDWQQPINQFFNDPDFKPLMNIIIQKYLGADVKDLLFELGRDDSTRLRGLVQLQTAESKLQQVELEKQSLQITRNNLQKQLLWGALSVALVVATILFFSFRGIRRRNRLLADKNREILMQQEELQAAQAQLILAEKKAALGRLMANISHELNSPLGAIRAHSQLLTTHVGHLQKLIVFLRNLPEEDFNFFSQLVQHENVKIEELNTKETRRMRLTLENSLRAHGAAEAEEIAQLLMQLGVLDVRMGIQAMRRTNGIFLLQQAAQFRQIQLGLANIATSVERTRKVLYALKSFQIENPHLPLARLNAAEVLEAELQTFGAKLAGIRQEKSIAPQLPVQVAKEDLQQLFHHLLQNALFAVAGMADAKISIVAATHGSFAMVRIADNGPGLPPEVQERLFEPFVSTRSTGEGSGLGLFICKRIVDLYNGQLLVDRAHEQTVFTVLLPLAQVPALEQEKMKALD